MGISRSWKDTFNQDDLKMISSMLELIYHLLQLFFCNDIILIKSEVDSNSMSRGSEISIPDNIRNSYIPPYRDQVNYRAIFLDEFFRITGVESKYRDSTQDNCWEAAIKQVINKILGKQIHLKDILLQIF